QQFYESKGWLCGGERKLSFHGKRKFSFPPAPPLTFKEKRGILVLGRTGRLRQGLAPYSSVLIRTHPYQCPAPPLTFKKKRVVLVLGRTGRLGLGLAPYSSVLIRTHPYKQGMLKFWFNFSLCFGR
ncbi:MAG: hypothetical protein IKC65_04160, partial [Lentisphaeria bacterium]|nr:hypothetical protein [Lentisphaeria bacterium]